MPRVTIFAEEKEKVNFENFNQVIEFGLAKYRSRFAFEIKRGLKIDRFTFDQVDRLSKKFASFLTDHNVGKGDRILIWGPNSPEWVICFFGALRLGVIVVPVDLQTLPEVTDRFIAQTKPKLLFIANSVDFTPAKQKNLPILALEDLTAAIEKLKEKEVVEVVPDDLAEIIFTSGSTGFPKGVEINHKNLATSAQVLVNYFPIFKRFTFTLLSVLPLSHIFEQVSDLMLPWIFGYKVVYLERQNSVTIIRALRRHKINGMFAVPQILKVLRLSMKRKLERAGYLPLFNFLLVLSKFIPSVLVRRLLFVPIHNQLGGRLLFVFSGGAPLEPKVAKTWERMGILVFQGYGATETTALTAVNFIGGTKIALVGKAMPSVELKLSPDGEIMVRGPQISAGYWQDKAKTAEAFEDGWYKTGDVGVIEPSGFLRLAGRAKFRIVLEDGQKVYPEDVEAKLNDHPDVKDSCVLGLNIAGHVVLHAVVLTKARQNLHRIVAEVNEELEPHQKIMEYSAWPGEDFPRLRTLKVDRLVVQRFVEGGMGTSALDIQKEEENSRASRLAKMIAQVCQVPLEDITDEKQMVLDLKLDSLRRVELLSAIEQDFGAEIEESKISDETTFGDLKILIAESEHHGVRERKRNNWPRWSPVVLFRLIIQQFLFAYHAFFLPLEVSGKENFQKISYPAIFFVNHIGPMDMFVALRLIPPGRRARVFIAADSRIWKYPLAGFLTELLIGAIPLVKKGEGIRESLEYTAEMIDNGYSLLIAPEGEVSEDGSLQPFRPGTALLAVELGLQAVPVKIDPDYRLTFPSLHGLPQEFLPHRFRHKIKVKIGQPLKFERGTSYDQATLKMYEEMKKL